ncbi:MULTISPECIES: SRPBCC domain-containing protein [Arthrobacter]|uniref:SRPBCC domain-containing protein n=2 Tax=Arthrobacter TaxID=1663 RepID=A0ABU9KIU4_9MICC|nr:SRPBCC domain-containing protein [Arthrobacter sp. YJM1]MDP5227014.1 SRPBCC domain-containing protein [Arthrobacter sp. YJM1]
MTENTWTPDNALISHELAETSVRLARRFPHPVTRVWEALTAPDLLARWWVPGDIAPVTGHRFTLDMGAWGPQQCEILHVEPGVSLRFLFAKDVLDTTVTWTLEAIDGGTVLHLEHAGFTLDSPMGKQAYNGMGNGWPAVVGRLDAVLAGTA